MSDLPSLEAFKSEILNMRRGSRGGHLRPHKLVMLLSVIGHNTIAVMLGDRDKRGDWLKSVRRLHRDARAEGDEALAGLLSAIMKLLNGRPIHEIEPQGLDTPHQAVWERIVSALERGSAPPEG